MQKSWHTFLYSLQGKWDIGAGIYWNVPTYLEIQKTEFVSDKFESQYLVWLPLLLNTTWTLLDKLSCNLFR